MVVFPKQRTRLAGVNDFTGIIITPVLFNPLFRLQLMVSQLEVLSKIINTIISLVLWQSKLNKLNTIKIPPAVRDYIIL